MKPRSVGDSIELRVSSRDPERILRPGVTIALGVCGAVRLIRICRTAPTKT